MSKAQSNMITDIPDASILVKMGYPDDMLTSDVYLTEETVNAKPSIEYIFAIINLLNDFGLQYSTRELMGFETVGAIERWKRKILRDTLNGAVDPVHNYLFVKKYEMKYRDRTVSNTDDKRRSESKFRNEGYINNEKEA